MKLTPTANKLIAEGGYRRGFPKAARALGGNFDPVRKVWIFRIDQADDVEAIAKQFYGQVLKGRRRNLSGTPRGAYSELAQAVEAQRRAEKKVKRTELLAQRDALMAQIENINAELAAL